ATPPPPLFTLSLPDALPISALVGVDVVLDRVGELELDLAAGHRALHPRPVHAVLLVDDHRGGEGREGALRALGDVDQENCMYRRSEEHTSELQSPYDLVCRL